MARKKLDTLTEQMYYVLLALTEERHGYGIMQDTAALTGGRVIIGAGTLYALLSRFEADGLIRLSAERDNRKYYRLTEEGRRVLEEELRRLQRQAADGERVRGAAGAQWRDMETGRSGRPAQARRVGRASPGMSPAPAVLLIRPGMGGVVK